jgi:hypothetical protein
MKPIIPFLARIWPWSLRTQPLDSQHRRRLLAGLFPILGIFALASMSGGQEAPQEADDSLAAEEVDKQSDDSDGNDRDKGHSYKINPTTSSPISVSVGRQPS